MATSSSSIADVRSAMVSASLELQTELLGKSVDAISQAAKQRRASTKATSRGSKRSRSPPSNQQPQRRSSRLSSQPTVSYSGAASASGSSSDSEDFSPQPPRSSFSQQAAMFAEENEPVSLPSGTKLVSVPPRDSSGAILAGPVSSKQAAAAVADCEQAWLGKYIPYSIAGAGAKAKAAAMFVLGAHTSPADVHTLPRCTAIKFNKMSGIQEWDNAVALFINVDVDALPESAPPETAAGPTVPSSAARTGSAGPAVPHAATAAAAKQQAAGPAVPSTSAAGQSVVGQYDKAAYHKDGSAYGNQFSEGGRTITWFAQPRHTTNTPVLQRIIPGLTGPDGEAQDIIPVVLFFRLPGRPYVFAGRCSVAAVDVDSSPIRVQWRMQHFDDLCSRAAHDEALEGWRDMHRHVFTAYGCAPLK